MKPKLPLINTFYEHQSTSEYDALYKEGDFVDKENGKKIILKEGANVRIIVPNIYILEEEIGRHADEKKEKVFKPDQEFYFDLPLKSGKKYRFYLKNVDTVFAVKKGNKRTEFKSTHCVVYKAVDHTSNKEIENFEPIQAESFNQAFARTSEKYRQNQSSHTTNIYNTFYTSNGELIDFIRDKIFGK